MTIETLTEATAAEIEVLPAQRPVQADAIGQLMLHAQAMQTAKQLADALCDTDLVPVTYRGKPGNGAAAILYGAELGLNPIQSLQQIFVVHGSPAIYARTAVALLKSRAGIVVQTEDSTDNAVTVSATDHSTGQVERSTWDIKRAERAGYTSNKKYQTDPQAMLYAKAAMEVCRKIAPDVLLGIPYSREELELEQALSPRRVASSRRGVDGLRAALAPTPEPDPAEDASSAPAPSEASDARRKWLNRMFALLAEGDCTDRTDQLIVIAGLAGLDELPPQRDSITDEELRTVVEALNAASKEKVLGGVITDLIQAYSAVEQ